MLQSSQQNQTQLLNGRQIIWQPQPGPQTALLTCPVEDRFFGGARGGGKTDGSLGDWLSHSGLYGENSKGIIFRKTMPELEEVKARAAQLFYPLKAEWLASQRTWIMPNKATLKLRYLENDDDASNYQGHSYNWVCFDELGNWVSPDPIDKIRATLRSPHGIPCRFLATGNPGGKGHEWVKKRYIDPAPAMTPFYDEDKKTWRVFIPSKLSDNKILIENDPSYINRIASSGPSWLVKAWLEGDWTAHQEGDIFKREWWRFYRELPFTEKIVQSWDTAFKDKQENDYSVCTTWAICQNGYYLIHVWKGKVQYPELRQTVILLANKFNPQQILIEDKASGQSIIQELSVNTRLAIKAIKIDRDKVARANACTPLIEAGKVFLPENNHHWFGTTVSDFIDNLSSFPNAAHDDEVDSTTQFLNEQNLTPQFCFGSVNFN